MVREKPKRITVFLLLSSVYILLLSAVGLWFYSPVPSIEKISSLPISKDLLIFRSRGFINENNIGGPYLLVLNTENQQLYEWHGITATETSWSKIQNEVLIVTGSSHGDDLYKNFLVNTNGKTEQIDIAGNGTLSPDGKKIAYIHSFSLFIYDLENRNNMQIATPNLWVRGDLAWSPDSNYIAFISTNEAYKESNNFEILYADVRDMKLFHLTGSINGNSTYNLQWSGDGSKLSFEYYSGEKWETSIVSVSNNGTFWQWPKIINQCQFYSYSWLHQDANLSVLCKSTFVELWMIDTETNESKLLGELKELALKEGYRPFNMTWSSDNSKLAFSAIDEHAHCDYGDVSMEFCSEDIYVFNTEKGTIQKISLTHRLEDIQDMVWVRISQ